MLDVRTKKGIPSVDDVRQACLQIMHEGGEISTGEILWFIHAVCEEIIDLNEQFSKLETEMLERTGYGQQKKVSNSPDIS